MVDRFVLQKVGDVMISDISSITIDRIQFLPYKYVICKMFRKQ